MKWYTFNDSESSSTVNMILDHNTTDRVAWSSFSNGLYMREAKVALENDTSTWNSNINARLIAADEIAKITGNSSFDVNAEDEWFYFDSNNQTQTANSTNKSKYAWLFDCLQDASYNGANIECEGTRGYWTSSGFLKEIIMAGGSSMYSAQIWNVGSYGSLLSMGSNIASVGIRPVITVSKDIIN